MARRRSGKSPELFELKPLTAVEGPELVFGLVGAVGTDLYQVGEVLAEQLSRVGYRAHTIRLSRLISQVPRFASLADLDFPSDFEKIREHMKAGSELRALAGRGDALALLSLIQIRALRQQDHGVREVPPPGSRTAYILKSLKHPAEIQSLRDIYGRAFYVISAYSPRETRITTLAARIAGSVHSADLMKFRGQAEELVAIDEREERDLGQNVGDAFRWPMCLLMPDRVQV